MFIVALHIIATTGNISNVHQQLKGETHCSASIQILNIKKEQISATNNSMNAYQTHAEQEK